MRAASLDLARSRPPIVWWQWLLLFVAIVFSMMSLLNYRANLNEIAKLNRQIAAAEKRHTSVPLKRSQSVDPATARAIKASNQLISRLQLPWESLFHEIETAQSKDIALLAVQPNAERRTLLLEGEARNAAAALDYIVALEAQPSLADVNLVSHEVRREDAEKPIRFTITAQWLRP